MAVHGAMVVRDANGGAVLLALLLGVGGLVLLVLHFWSLQILV